MDRLTKPPHSIVLPVSTLSESVDKLAQIYMKLWEYENSELSPSEVAALKAENAELHNCLKDLAHKNILNTESQLEFLDRAEAAKKQTNFERVTANIEALVEFSRRIKRDGRCGFCAFFDKNCGERKCADGIRQWLEQEAEE